MRIPRKKKKAYKKLWFKRTGIKRYVIKSSIERYGCMTRLKYDTI